SSLRTPAASTHAGHSNRQSMACEVLRRHTGVTICLATIRYAEASKALNLRSSITFYQEMPELFSKFEIYKEPKWPTLLRLIGGSVVLHLGLLWVVVYVPAFRDALNIAALIA